jgi:hypothetical protein
LSFLPTAKRSSSPTAITRILHETVERAWRETQLPGEKGDEYVLYDISMLTYDRGYAVGYTSATREPLLLQRDPAGWVRAVTYAESDREHIYSVAMFPPIKPAGVGPSDDDDDARGRRRDRRRRDG